MHLGPLYTCIPPQHIQTKIHTTYIPIFINIHKHIHTHTHIQTTCTTFICTNTCIPQMPCPRDYRIKRTWQLLRAQTAQRCNITLIALALNYYLIIYPTSEEGTSPAHESCFLLQVLQWKFRRSHLNKKPKCRSLSLAWSSNQVNTQLNYDGHDCAT